MVDTSPRNRRPRGVRLLEAEARAVATAKRLARQLHQVEKLEVAVKRTERSTASDARRADTRRKIIAGALALEDKDPRFRGKLRALIDEYVTADRDRALFGLESLPGAGTTPQAA